MSNNEQENCNRHRRRLGLKHGLTVLCLVAFANLSWAQNYNSEFTFNLKKPPYPLSMTLNSSIPEKKHAVEKISEDKKNYCFKPECIHTASRILNFMDENFDPCDNFYEFACGQYMKKHEKSDHNYVRNNIISMEEEIKEKMKRILEQDLKPTEPKYLKLMKTFYRNCMNSAGDVKEYNSKAAVNILTKINGWHYLKNSPKENESFYWEKYLAKIIQETTFYKTFFFESDVEVDAKNNSNNVLHIGQPSEFAPTNFNSIKYFLPELSKRNVPFETVMVKIQEVEKLLINISIPEDDRKRHNFERISVKELEEKYSNILWREIFNGILQPTTEVRDDDIVLVSDSNFFEKFNEHINNISKQDQAIYLTWTAVKNIIITNDLQISKKNDVWEKCFRITKTSFMTNLGAVYVKNYVNEETVNKHIDEMITNIFHQFNIIIKNVNWLDQKTKDYALEKLSSLYAERQTIYQISDDKEIDEFYSNLEITAGDFFDSVLNITKFNKKLYTNFVRVPSNRSSVLFRMDATGVGAYYMFGFNSFGISPGMFRGIFFNESRPMYMNYGAMGSVAGHELTHGFDSDGKHYDKNGNLNDWWEAGSQKRFDEKTQCFIPQYQDYKIEEINVNVNGIRTQGENIADSVGLKISYSAYQKWVKDHGYSEPLLPGLNFTQSQLFWISFAQVLCHKESPNNQKAFLKLDRHSPPKFRVIGSLSNSPEFAKDFQCPVGSKMNPKTKCSVW